MDTGWLDISVLNVIFYFDMIKTLIKNKHEKHFASQNKDCDLFKDGVVVDKKIICKYILILYVY